ncbi:MAG: hypothetical protein MI923_22490 [Phycisphaerales bacterium]|nr:hypothetical protein [Phycisphaerales bacterium]
MPDGRYVVVSCNGPEGAIAGSTGENIWIGVSKACIRHSGAVSWKKFTDCVAGLSQFRSIISSPSWRRAALQQRAWFWRAFRIWSKVRFRSLSLYVRGRDDLNERVRSSRLFRDFVRLSLGNIIISLVIVFVLVKLDRILLKHWNQWGIWFSTYYNRPDFGIYSTYFATLAGIAGVFLGLYFTAVSVVAGTGYAKASPILRDLLLRDKVGNVYVKFVMILGISSLILTVLCDLSP